MWDAENAATLEEEEEEEEEEERRIDEACEVLEVLDKTVRQTFIAVAKFDGAMFFRLLDTGLDLRRTSAGAWLSADFILLLPRCTVHAGQEKS